MSIYHLQEYMSIFVLSVFDCFCLSAPPRSFFSSHLFHTSYPELNNSGNGVHFCLYMCACIHIYTHIYMQNLGFIPELVFNGYFILVALAGESKQCQVLNPEQLHTRQMLYTLYCLFSPSPCIFF